jgi:hypothetical protein
MFSGSVIMAKQQKKPANRGVWDSIMLAFGLAG